MNPLRAKPQSEANGIEEMQRVAKEMSGMTDDELQKVTPEEGAARYAAAGFLMRKRRNAVQSQSDPETVWYWMH